MAERIESDMEVSFEAMPECPVVVSPLVETLMQKSKQRQQYMQQETDMVDILEEGLKLKLDLHNLKKEFQDILDARSCYLKSESSTSEDTTSKPRKDMVLVSSDFNTGRVKSDPTGLVVSDRPSSQASPSRRTHARSVYRNHKRRLMARRESGDGAPPEGKATVSTPASNNHRMVSPMRRIPIKEKLTELGSPFGLMPKQDCLKAITTPSSLPGNRDYKTLHRPSPEGLVAPQTRQNSCTRSVSEQYNSQDNKPANKKRCKKQFPKTPKSAKMAVRQLQTIGENEQISLQNRKRNLFGEKPTCSTESDAESDVFTKIIKDITNISHISGKNLREQPSSANFREQFHTTFDYPLHSTMSYPLHSTMQNAHKGLNLSDSESDMSSIVIESPHNQKSSKEFCHTKSSSGISLADSDNNPTTSPRSHVISKQKYVNLSKAEGVNMDTFSCDEGILSNDESEESVHRVNVPVTPVGVVRDYYTLTYTPEELKQEALDCESDCNSSYLSFNVDNPTDDHHHHRQQGHNNMQNMVSCRCHVNQVYRIRRQTGFLEHSERSTQFVESTLSMDTRMRAIHPVELEMLSHKPHTSSSHHSTNSSTKHSSRGKKPASNRINADSLLTSQSDLVRDCQVSEKKPTSYARRDCDKVVLKPVPGADTNCLNLGKILKVKEGKKDFVENTIINHTLANPNVTMVAKGCLGFLKRKSKSSKKKSASGEKKRNQQFEDEEDKENFRSRYQASQSRVKSQGVSCEFVRGSEVSQCSSMASNMDHELKRKLSKRMRDFRETTFTDPHRMSYQTMGHI